VTTGLGWQNLNHICADRRQSKIYHSCEEQVTPHDVLPLLVTPIRTLPPCLKEFMDVAVNFIRARTKPPGPSSFLPNKREHMWDFCSEPWLLRGLFQLCELRFQVEICLRDKKINLHVHNEEFAMTFACLADEFRRLTEMNPDFQGRCVIASEDQDKLAALFALMGVRQERIKAEGPLLHFLSWMSNRR